MKELIKDLKATKLIEIRFNEVDSMGLVWHGHYAKFFEDAREEFGKKFGLSYMDIYDAGFYAPLVELNFKYKKPLTYRGKVITVEICYRDSNAAKLLFDYALYDVHGELTTVGSSTQVFLDKDYQLSWQIPKFFLEWKNKNLY